MTRSSVAFLFPGQGSQAVGMGVALADSYPAAREVFEEVDDALGENLSEIMQNGPDDVVRMTRNAQPALFATSMAAVRVLEAELGASLTECGGMAAGHSLGEYSALAAVGSLSIFDAARLLRQRGDAMQSAVPIDGGAMAALLGADELQIKSILEEAKLSGIVQIANDNAPGQIVISGAATAVDAAIEIGRVAGLRRVIKLPVSAPFHCDLMAPAAAIMEEALTATNLRDAAIPVYCNVTAVAETNSIKLKENLVKQVTARVRWRESIIAMNTAGAKKFVELGTGKVLSGLVKRGIEAEAIVNLDGPDDLDSVLAQM